MAGFFVLDLVQCPVLAPNSGIKPVSKDEFRETGLSINLLQKYILNFF
jgi:hypothetical protein